MPKIFVNRDKAKAWFKNALDRVPADGVAIKVFHGAGGQGKSALCYELHAQVRRESFNQYNRIVKTSRISFEFADNRTDPIVFLIRMRNGFAEQGISLPGFDLALAFVWEQVRPQDTPRELTNAWLSRRRDDIGEGVCDTVEAVRESVPEEISKIPFMGIVLRKTVNWFIDKTKFQLLLQSRDYLPDFFRDGQVKDDHELIDSLTIILAKDLAHARAKDNRITPVLLLDEYESLFAGGGAGRLYQDQPLDRALRRFMAAAQGVLVVLFTRTPPDWAKSPFWDYGPDDWFDITGLEKAYAQAWLTQAGIEEADLQTAMLDSARVEEQAEERYYPLLLNLCLEHHGQMHAGGRPLAPTDFAVAGGSLDYRLQELLGRILKDHQDDSLQKTFHILALMDRFDAETLAFVVDHFNTGLLGDGFALFARLSFMEADGQGRLSIHKKIAEVSRHMEAEHRPQGAEDAVIAHLLKRAAVELPKDMNDEKAALIIDAAAMRLRQGVEGYVEWLGEKSSALMDAARAREDESLWQEALDLCQRELGEEHPDTVTGYNNVAYHLKAFGRYQEAGPLYRKALDIRQRGLGKDHPNTAASYNELASNLDAQEQHKEAEPLFRTALDIRQRILGEEHPDTATSYNNLAGNFNAQERYEEAEPLLRTALDICQRELGDEHPNTATSYNNLAVNLDDQGRTKEAEPFLRKALDICQRVLGEDHPSTATNYNNLAVNLDDQGRTKEAEPFLRKALDICQRVLGEEHPTTRTIANNLEILL